MSTGAAADSTATAAAKSSTPAAPAPPTQAPAQDSPSPSAPASALGPLIRLWGIPTAQLPSGDASGDELRPFLAALVREAVPFIDAVAPKSGEPATVWKHKADKTSPDSEARVEVYERVVGGAELERIQQQMAGGAGEDQAGAGADDNEDGRGKGGKGGKAGKDKKKKKLADETWMCRRSVHADAARTGTASWGEFFTCFAEEHADAEWAFTPNVAAGHEALSWRSGSGSGFGARSAPPMRPIDVAEEGGGRSSWTNFRLRIQEMRHHIGAPLKDRTFVVLQMVAELEPAGREGSGEVEDEFLVVSVPVPDFGAAAAGMSRLAAERGAQLARYVSVERLRRIPGSAAGGGGEEGEGDSIEWLMATASDAGGVLPMWVQNMAMPSVVWKDVPLFLKWIAEERQTRDVAKEGVKGKSHKAGAHESQEKAKAKDKKGVKEKKSREKEEPKAAESTVKATSDDAAKAEAAVEAGTKDGPEATKAPDAANAPEVSTSEPAAAPAASKMPEAEATEDKPAAATKETEAASAPEATPADSSTAEEAPKAAESTPAKEDSPAPKEEPREEAAPPKEIVIPKVVDAPVESAAPPAPKEVSAAA